MRIRAILTAAGLAAAALAVVPLSAAHANTSAKLALTGYYQMAVDSTHGHLFFSQGSASQNTILVTDFSGNTVATITGQTGVKGIALSPDGSTLYAALSGAHEVSAISTATLQQTATYPLGDTLTPVYVAVQSGKLWVSYDPSVMAVDSAVGDFDLSAANPAFETQPAMGAWGSAPMIATDPADTGNVLVAIQPGSQPAEVESFNTAPDPATLRARSYALTFGSAQSCWVVRDLAVVPGGSQFIAACTGADSHIMYSTADLSSQGSYASGGYPDSIAIAQQTGLVAAGGGYGPRDIYVYAQGGHTPLNVFQAGTNTGLVYRGLGVTADGSELFAITQAAGAYTLHTYVDPALKQPTLTLSALPSLTFGHSATFAGVLSTGSTSPVAGASVTVTRTGPGGTATLGTFTTGTNGKYSVTDTPAALGSYTYTASFAGSATLAPATATAKVSVVKPTPALSISVTPTSATYRPVEHLTVHLGPTDGDRTVSVYAKPAGSTRPVLLKTGTVNSAGTLKLTFPGTHTTTFSAVFAGDATYGAKTVTATAKVAARVTMKTAGYYASERIGSVNYRLYHRAKRLLAAVAVAPNKHGECVEFDVQEFYKGKWYDNPTACGTLDKNSTLGGYFTLSQADLGYHYRIRAEYLRGKDTTNLGADSSWQYFIVEK